jgi:lysozyme
VNLDLIYKTLEGFEGNRLKSYQDQRGRWTIGIGQTGPGIGPGTVWTQDQVTKALVGTVGALVPRIVGPQGCVRVALNDNQIAALTSFAYNEGINALRKSLMLRYINNSDFTNAAEQFSRWVFIGTGDQAFKVPGLVTRRAAEATLFLSPVTPVVSSTEQATG